MSDLTCAISIATHNRLSELQRTLGVVAQLSPAPDKLLICADGCTDGTIDFIRAEFPRANLLVHPEPHGSIRSRVELMRAAGSDLVLSLDDDSYPIEPDFIARLRAQFAAMPHVAVLSFPQRSDEFPASLTQPDFGPSRYVANYVNAAAAFRRAIFLQLEGWPAEFEHSYDETDYTLQCLAAGFAVYHETGLTIRHHFTSLARNEIRTHHRHSRNEQWSMWRRCPLPDVLALAPYRALSQFNYARKRGLSWILREPQWWLMALRGLPRALRHRHPTPRHIYRRWLNLIRRPILGTEEWKAAFLSR